MNYQLISYGLVGVLCLLLIVLQYHSFHSKSSTQSSTQSSTSILPTLLEPFTTYDDADVVNNRRVLISETIHNFNKAILYYDDTDINDKSAGQLLCQLFPFVARPIAFPKITSLQNAVVVAPMIMIRYLANKFPLHFIGSLYNVHLTLLLPVNQTVATMDDFQNLNIATFHELQYSYLFLYIFQRSMNINLRITPCQSYGELHNVWSSKQCNAIFLIVSHPNQFVRLFSYQEQIKLFDWNIFMSNVNFRRLMSFHFPNLIATTFPLRGYRMFSSVLYANSYGFTVSMVSDSSIPDDCVYDLLTTLYTNTDSIYGSASQIKTNYQFMYNLNASWMSSCPPNLQYHSGAKQFYTDINKITTMPDGELCYLTRYKCNKKTYNNVMQSIMSHLGIL